MKLKPGLRDITKPLYINANIIFSECLQRFKGKKSETLSRLISCNFTLVTSILTRSETIRQLSREKSVPKKQARTLFEAIRSDYKILLISNIQEIISINDAFFEEFCDSKLTLPDFIHVSIVRKMEIPMCTHDKKMLGKTHFEKQSIYSEIYKPHELIKYEKEV